MKKLLLLAVTFWLLPIVLVATIVYISAASQPLHGKNLLSLHNNTVVYAALPYEETSLIAKLSEKDIRISLVENFLSRYGSPLLPYASSMVEKADAYNIDYKLLPSIAMQESNLCKKIIKNSHNCWGFGIYGKTVTKFDNYDQAIDTVSKTLARDYIAQGLTTPEQIMTKYTPSNTGEWADSVNFFMQQLSL